MTSVRPDDITLGQMRAVIGASAPLLISIDWMLAPSHQARIEVLYRALDFAISLLVETRHLKQKHGEDALTSELVNGLKGMNIDANHDTDVGGHADIVVRGKDNFLWVTEAKRHRSYDWLLQGFDQLTTRYMTGMRGQQNGGLIVYCFAEDALQILNNWLDHLRVNRNYIELDDSDGLERSSSHIHEGAGTPFEVRHVMIPLHWKPRVKA